VISTRFIHYYGDDLPPAVRIGTLNYNGTACGVWRQGGAEGSHYPWSYSVVPDAWQHNPGSCYCMNPSVEGALRALGISARTQWVQDIEAVALQDAGAFAEFVVPR